MGECCSARVSPAGRVSADALAFAVFVAGGTVAEGKAAVVGRFVAEEVETAVVAGEMAAELGDIAAGVGEMAAEAGETVAEAEGTAVDCVLQDSSVSLATSGLDSHPHHRLASGYS